MALHFCAMPFYSNSNDTIAIENEADSDQETKDNKKEHKLNSGSFTLSQISYHQKGVNSIHSHKNWNPPHIEISNPPPELS